MISKSIKKLVNYGIETGLISRADEIYARNRILEILRVDEYKESAEKRKDLAFKIQTCDAPWKLH